MFTREQAAAARRLRAQGMSYQAIGDQLGMSRASASRLVNRDSSKRRPDCPECGAELVAEPRPSRRLWLCPECGHTLTRWSLLTPEQKAASNVAAMASGRRLRERQRAIINEAKRGPCADCGQSYPPWAMHFHHLRDKVFTIGDVAHTTCSETRLRAEIAKCVVLCGGCHPKRHAVTA